MVEALRKLVEQRLNVLDNEIGYERYSEHENDVMREERDDLRKVLELLGATGDLAAGKTETAAGNALNIQIAHDDKGNVVINFGMLVAWLSIPAKDAADFALAILAHAGARMTITVDDAMVDRIVEYHKERVPGGDMYLSRGEWKAALQYAIHGQLT